MIRHTKTSCLIQRVYLCVFKFFFFTFVGIKIGCWLKFNVIFTENVYKMCFCMIIFFFYLIKKKIFLSFQSLSVPLAAPQTLGIEHMSTIRTDTTNAVALLIGRGTTTRTITETVPFLPLELGPALQLVLLVGALTRQNLILSLESVIPSLCLVLLVGILTATIGDDASIGLTIIAGVDLLIPRNHDTLLHKGPRDRPPKPPIPQKELLFLQAGVHDHVPEADRPARIQSAAPAVQEAAGR